MTELWISWSALRVHEECKQKGFLMRSGKRAQLENVRMFLPGTVTDNVVRDWLNNDPEHNLGIMPDMVDQTINTAIEKESRVVAWKSPSDRNKVLADCQEAVTKIEPLLLQYVVPFEYQADFRFRAPLEIPINGTEITQQVILNGAMDIIVRDHKKNWHVYDVKHTRDDYYYKKTAGQMLFYDFVTEIMFGQAAATTALLQPLCKERFKPIPTTGSERVQIMQRISAMANDIRRKDFTPRDDTSICQYCSVRHACTKFKPVIKNGKKRVEI